MPAAVTELESIYRQHHAGVLRLAYRITGSASDAEDVVQTVFLRMVRRGFRSADVQEPRHYLNRATANAALDVLRSRHAAHLSVLDETAAAASVSAEHGHELSELRDSLRAALARLNPRSAEMFVLRYLHDYSNAEVARAMDTSAAVVAVTLFRARTRLRRDLSAFAGGRHARPQS